MRILPSSGQSRIEAKKRDLVLSLFTKRGEFWDMVSGIRARWNIQAKVGIPPHVEVYSLHFPPEGPKYAPPTEEGGEEWSRFAHEWDQELVNLYDQTIPEEYRLNSIPDTSRALWTIFLSACVVYDPPE